MKNMQKQNQNDPSFILIRFINHLMSSIFGLLISVKCLFLNRKNKDTEELEFDIMALNKAIYEAEEVVEQCQNEIRFNSSAILKQYPNISQFREISEAEKNKADGPILKRTSTRNLLASSLLERYYRILVFENIRPNCFDNIEKTIFLARKDTISWMDALKHVFEIIKRAGAPDESQWGSFFKPSHQDEDLRVGEFYKDIFRDMRKLLKDFEMLDFETNGIINTYMTKAA